MPGSQASLSLFPAEAPTPTAAENDSTTAAWPRSRQRRDLWLCLHLKRLCLEVFDVRAGDGPTVLLEADRQGLRVFATCEAARREGIAPGMPVNAALAVVPELATLHRDPVREARALERLAAWAGQFTSQVVIPGTDLLLLEIGRSLRLFGGLDSLQRAVEAGLAATGYTARRALAPTGLAAIWLARAGRPGTPEPSALAGALGPLPLACTGWPPDVRKTLAEMGLERVGDCLRLPRDGFGRRLGKRYLDDLDRAMGRRPDAWPAFQAPERFSGTLELPVETLDHGRLCHGMERLVVQLEGLLRGCQAGVTELHSGFLHRAGPATRMTLGLVAPAWDADFLMELFAERLERQRLAAPVIGLALSSGTLIQRRLEEASLFARPGGSAEKGELERLLARLRARLGSEAVRGLCLLPEHRPEAAWDYAEPGTGSPAPAADRRPFWMLDNPQPLETYLGGPCLDGPLRLVAGPERIESGWWDGRDVARDYYTAQSRHGAWLWIFRDRRPPREWWLHGVFG